MSPALLLIMLIGGAVSIGASVSVAVLAWYRWWVPGSTVASVAGPLRLPWWAAWVLVPALVLSLLGWALAASAGSRRMTRALGRAALFFFVAFASAWLTTAVGSYAMQAFFPMWLREPLQS